MAQVHFELKYMNCFASLLATYKGTHVAKKINYLYLEKKAYIWNIFITQVDLKMF